MSIKYSNSFSAVRARYCLLARTCFGRARVITGRLSGWFESRRVVSRESGSSLLRLPVIRTSCCSWQVCQTTRSGVSRGNPSLANFSTDQPRSSQNFFQEGERKYWCSASTCPSTSLSATIPDMGRFLQRALPVFADQRTDLGLGPCLHRVDFRN